jgi:hypothetical protein
MATGIRLTNVVGSLVYRRFKPNKPGKIIGFQRDEPPFWHVVEVQWIDGTRTSERLEMMNDFHALISDHERKAEKFRKMAESL